MPGIMVTPGVCVEPKRRSCQLGHLMSLSTNSLDEWPPLVSTASNENKMLQPTIYQSNSQLISGYYTSGHWDILSEHPTREWKMNSSQIGTAFFNLLDVPGLENMYQPRYSNQRYSVWCSYLEAMDPDSQQVNHQCWSIQLFSRRPEGVDITQKPLAAACWDEALMNHWQLIRSLSSGVL